MCGRFFIENDIEDIIEAYRIKQVRNLGAVKGEIFPGTNIPIVMNTMVRSLDFFRWGFQIKGMGREIINARIETAGEKPTFKRAFLNSRCIVPANAFFEWETTEKSKVKYKIEVKDKKIFSMAGIYDMFTDKDNNEYFGVVLLTRPANEEMSKLHHRMPVIIDKEKEDKWLEGSSEEILDMQEALETDTSIKLNIYPAEGNRQLSIYDLI